MNPATPSGDDTAISPWLGAVSAAFVAYCATSLLTIWVIAFAVILAAGIGATAVALINRVRAK